MNLFKSKKKTNNAIRENTISEEEMNKVDITVHAMPERFRVQNDSVNDAKNIGILVLIFGFIFLIVMGLLFYYYVFKSSEEEANTIAVEESEKTQKKPEVKEPETKPEVKEPERIVIEPEIATSTEEEEEEPTVIMAYQPAPDSDSDGLSDAEELLIGSNTKLPDSDADGYEDLSELTNLFNPSGEGLLVDNENFEKYTNKTFSYQLIKPLSWSMSKFGGDDSVMFEAVNSQFIQVIVQPNSNKDRIDEWYKNQFSKTAIDQSKVVTKPSWDGIYSDDGLTIYVTDKANEHIITITYNIGTTNRLFYKSLFNVIVNSFIIN